MKKAKSLGLRKLRAENARLKLVFRVYKKDREKIAIRLCAQIESQSKNLVEIIALQAKKEIEEESCGAYFIHQQEY